MASPLKVEAPRSERRLWLEAGVEEALQPVRAAEARRREARANCGEQVDAGKSVDASSGLGENLCADERWRDRAVASLAPALLRCSVYRLLHGGISRKSGRRAAPCVIPQRWSADVAERFGVGWRDGSGNGSGEEADWGASGDFRAGAGRRWDGRLRRERIRFRSFPQVRGQWKAGAVKPEEAVKMRELRAAHDVGPISIHASYLINLCSQTESVRKNSTAAFRGEVERALAWGAEYLVLHPGSWKGLTREEGLRLAAESIVEAVDGIDFGSADGKRFRILIENTAGAEFSLGGKLEQVAELVSCFGEVCAGGGVSRYLSCSCGGV